MRLKRQHFKSRKQWHDVSSDGETTVMLTKSGETCLQSSWSLTRLPVFARSLILTSIIIRESLFNLEISFQTWISAWLTFPAGETSRPPLNPSWSIFFYVCDEDLSHHTWTHIVKKSLTIFVCSDIAFLPCISGIFMTWGVRNLHLSSPLSLAYV